MGKGLSYLEELRASSEAFGTDADGAKAWTKIRIGRADTLLEIPSTYIYYVSGFFLSPFPLEGHLSLVFFLESLSMITDCSHF